MTPALKCYQCQCPIGSLDGYAVLAGPGVMLKPFALKRAHAVFKKPICTVCVMSSYIGYYHQALLIRDLRERGGSAPKP